MQLVDRADSGRRTAVVGGFETDRCVAQSAIPLHDLNFRVVVPEERFGPPPLQL